MGSLSHITKLSGSLARTHDTEKGTDLRKKITKYISDIIDSLNLKYRWGKCLGDN